MPVLPPLYTAFTMMVLGYESSCDETGVALVCTRRGLLAHALHSQIAMHQAYGGVVPELASRDHIQRVLPLTDTVLREAAVTLAQVDVLAYTAGPGLAGALLVGASVAQSLAWALDKPAVPIHHLEGHLLSPLLAQPAPDFPFVALLVSGGHTQLMQVDGVGRYRLLGETLDDAAGEAFDKTAKLLGLGYPGGPALSKLAERGDADRYKLPRPMLHSAELDMSFSGLKTAVLTQVRRLQVRRLEKESGSLAPVSSTATLTARQRADLAAATQAAIVDVLAGKALRAMRQTGLTQLVVAGGVGANQRLRQRLQGEMEKRGGRVFFPPLALCTDNGAMIAFAAALRLQAGLVDMAQARTHAFTVQPRWVLGESGQSAR